MNVFLIAATSADGFIARNNSEFIDWTSKEDKKFFAERTKSAGVIIFGRNTFETINKALPDRRTIVMTSKPMEFDGVEVTNESPNNLIQRLESEGCYEVAICGGSSIYTAFLEAGLINEIYLTVEPILLGKGINLTNNNLDLKLDLLESTKLNDNVLLLHYKVAK